MMLLGLGIRDSTFAMVLIAFSTLVNIILALLIVLRLVHHRRHIRKVLGVEHGSLYSKVITMCVESSALIVIFSGVYTALIFEQAHGSLIPFLLLPHICVGNLEFRCASTIDFLFAMLSQVISSLLIVYRVAKGRVMTTTLQPSERETARICFDSFPSSLVPHSQPEEMGSFVI